MKFFIKTIYLILLFGLFLLNSTKGFSKSDIKKYTKEEITVGTGGKQVFIILIKQNLLAKFI